MDLMPRTTITIDTELRDQLRARGRMGESYGDVIARLLAETTLSGSPPSKPAADATVARRRPWRPIQDS